MVVLLTSGCVLLMGTADAGSGYRGGRHIRTISVLPLVRTRSRFGNITFTNSVPPRLGVVGVRAVYAAWCQGRSQTALIGTRMPMPDWLRGMPDQIVVVLSQDDFVSFICAVAVRPHSPDRDQKRTRLSADSPECCA